MTPFDICCWPRYCKSIDQNHDKFFFCIFLNCTRDYENHKNIKKKINKMNNGEGNGIISLVPFAIFFVFYNFLFFDFYLSFFFALVIRGFFFFIRINFRFLHLHLPLVPTVLYSAKKKKWNLVIGITLTMLMIINIKIITVTGNMFSLFCYYFIFSFKFFWPHSAKILLFFCCKVSVKSWEFLKF